jgi:hypothetical protein
LAAWLQEAGRRTRPVRVPAAEISRLAPAHTEYRRTRVLVLLLLLTITALGYGYLDLQLRIDRLPVVTAF